MENKNIIDNELENVNGGCFDMYDILLEDVERQEREKEAKKQAEANQPGARAHGSGASGGW